MGTFVVDINRYAEKAKANMHQVTRQVVIGVLSGVDQRSPVGNPELWASNIDRATRGLPPQPKGYVGGRFRANNQIGVDFLPTTSFETVDPTGSTTTSNNIAKVPEQAGGHLFFVANNLPYATALENGHSSQAPLGIYGLTAIEFQKYVNDALAALPK